MPIQILPPRLANQIAAGEVVERPSSVVKELVENSMDAGATQITIDIVKGGHKQIKVTDNGSGIDKEELSLALSRHATSKIHCLDDLEAIVSMGFRGEALASISSVSRLTLTSKTADSEAAWQAFAQGRDMAVEVKPAAHPVGTSVDVMDLFFNTPARRKFLRTEKTEFAHIEEVIKRLAIANLNVEFTLIHNGKRIKKYAAIIEPKDSIRRIADVCGRPFAKNAMGISAQADDLKLTGWIASPSHSRTINDVQFCVVNSRMMKDKLILHALKECFASHLETGMHPCYVINLELDPRQVDVNVHPAKHEVRFHQPRLIHDFIVHTIKQVLQQDGVGVSSGSRNLSKTSEHRYQAPQSDVAQSERVHEKERPTGDYFSQFQRLMQTPIQHSLDKPADSYQLIASLEQGFSVVNNEAQVYVLSNKAAYRHHLGLKFSQGVIPQPLLMPVTLNVDAAAKSNIDELTKACEPLGFSLERKGKKLLIKTTPTFARGVNLVAMMERLLADFAKELDFKRWLLDYLCDHMKLDEPQFVRQLLTEFNLYSVAELVNANVIKPASFDETIKEFCQ